MTLGMYLCVCMHAHVYLSVSGVYKAVIKDSAAADMMGSLSDGPHQSMPTGIYALGYGLDLVISF